MTDPYAHLGQIVAAVRAAPADLLRDPFWVANWVASAGLYDDGRPLYGAWDAYRAPRGAPGVWQHPDEFAAFLIGTPMPGLVLDLGCFHGLGSVLMAAYWPEAVVIAADSWDWVGKDNRRRLESLVWERVRFHPGTTADFYADWRRDDWRIDLAFIDADHSRVHVEHDYGVLKGVARRCAFHDIADDAVANTPHYGGGVRAFWDDLRAANPGRCVEYLRPDGVPHFGIGVIDHGP